MKIIKSRLFKILILILSLNLPVISEISKQNLYSNNNFALLVDFPISDNNSKDFGEDIDAIVGLREKVLRWDEFVSQLSLNGMENKFSYQDESLVKIREDNKIEFIVKRESIDFTLPQIDFFSRYDIEINKEFSSLNTIINCVINPLFFCGRM